MKEDDFRLARFHHEGWCLKKPRTDRGEHDDGMNLSLCFEFSSFGHY